jgi:hypothetical protein
VTDEQLRTILHEVTGVLNNRPIGWDEEGIAITPQQVLQPVSRTAARFPSGTASVYPLWKRAAEVALSFWKKWKNSVLSQSSQQAMSEKGRLVPLREGQVVLVAGRPDAFHQGWKLGKIVKLHKTSGDGQARLIEVKTENGIEKVGLNRVALLEDVEGFSAPEELSQGGQEESGQSEDH